MTRRMHRAAALAVLVAVSVVAGSRSADAVSHTHHLGAVTNSSTAVEHSAHVTFSCSDSTGKFTVKFTNVQVIEADQVTPWPLQPPTNGYEADFVLKPNPTDVDESVIVPLVQNATNGLYGGTLTGTLNSAASCHTGESAYFAGPVLGAFLSLSSTLS